MRNLLLAGTAVLVLSIAGPVYAAPPACPIQGTGTPVPLTQFLAGGPYATCTVTTPNGLFTFSNFTWVADGVTASQVALGVIPYKTATMQFGLDLNVPALLGTLGYSIASPASQALNAAAVDLQVDQVTIVPIYSSQETIDNDVGVVLATINTNNTTPDASTAFTQASQDINVSNVLTSSGGPGTSGLFEVHMLFTPNGQCTWVCEPNQ